MQNPNPLVLATSASLDMETSRSLLDVLRGEPSQDDFFIFAGKIYRRQESFSLLQLVRANAALALPLILGLLVASGLSLSKPLLTLGRHAPSETAKRSRSKRGKLIRLTHSCRAQDNVSFAVQWSPSHSVQSKADLKVLSEAMKALASSSVPAHPQASLQDELKELSAAMKSLAATSKPSKVSLITLEAKRKSLIRTRNMVEFHRELKELRLILPGSDVSSSHPLSWRAVQTSEDELIQRAALAVPFLSSPPTVCPRCNSENACENLSARRRVVLRDIVSRGQLDATLEKIALLSLTRSERPEEIFDEENSLRVMENVRASWNTISRTSYITEVVFSSDFEEFANIKPSDANLDSLLLNLETCLIRKGASFLRLSCGIVKGGSMYSLRAPSTSFAAMFDCIFDAQRHTLYLNAHSLSIPSKSAALSVVCPASPSPPQHLVVGLARESETLLRRTLALESEYSESYAVEVNASLLAAIETRPSKVVDALRSELRLPQTSLISLSVMDSICSSLNHERAFASPLANTERALFVGCVSKRVLETGNAIVLVLLRDRALCGCVIERALEKAAQI